METAGVAGFAGSMGTGAAGGGAFGGSDFATSGDLAGAGSGALALGLVSAAGLLAGFSTSWGEAGAAGCLR